MDKTLAQAWHLAATDLGIEIVAPFCITLPDGSGLTADVLVKGFGATNGMLLFDNYARIGMHSDAVSSCGYGYSVMDDPLPSEDYVREDYIRVLNDWGWTGTEAGRPDWVSSEE